MPISHLPRQALLAVALALSPAAALAQISQDISRDIAVDHREAFRGDHIVLSGVAISRSGTSYGCLLVEFEIATPGGMARQEIQLGGLRGGTRVRFSGTLPPGKGVRYLGARTCGAKIVTETPPPAPEPATKPVPPPPPPVVAKPVKTCTLAGTLKGDLDGFVAANPMDRNSRKERHSLSTIRLRWAADDRVFAAASVTKVARSTATFVFRDVPGDDVFNLEVSGFFVLDERFTEVWCEGYGGTTRLDPVGVTFVYDY
ncbi:MAG: hypothetical protein KDA73_17915 [Rhodobacteraceae bacterium]|nr:hypothetical protein [Paracoccaceae bacterium]